MPKLTASKEEVTGQKPVPEGLYHLRLKGFKPQLSKGKDSVNLNPQLEIVNSAEYNNRRIFESLNTKAKWAWKDFCGAFGVPIQENPDGSLDFPGEFPGSGNDPTKWGDYRGPLLGQVGQAYLIEVPVLDASGQPGVDRQGNATRNQVKYYVNPHASAVPASQPPSQHAAGH